mmetsp:Transcript_86702/g.136784  ORF Transcript_86702/g.136784 Transcript_86702/m.136784 type:complete len:227 (-) Transcript_86702:143-823(-)|eukprot:CAMPEP_0169272406 /NCGR_PEP_ID=MMETSP1016-20121227/50420_1 /TAXON_ID=342587 /ORGANISM="Karlodinium micrum, Strain CCMP2283" /LENGTH=226 /DNA_ID=CAMNT_0009358389 /DNA_START=68 /DNA_END=748 /DNA_ORIENTATION=-
MDVQLPAFVNDSASWLSCPKETSPAIPFTIESDVHLPPVKTADDTWSSVPPESAYFPQKRHMVSSGGSLEDGVAALLPKMKRMRLRPSLGQLRLQREADDTDALPPEVKLQVEPEQLRVYVSLEIVSAYAAGGSDLVHLELSFPPQYPHRPPRISQTAPDGCLPFWRYEGRFIVLERLSERGWSSAMGITDIVKDLLQPLGLAGSNFSNAFSMGSSIRDLGDVEMV